MRTFSQLKRKVLRKKAKGSRQRSSSEKIRRAEEVRELKAFEREIHKKIQMGNA